MRGLRLEELPRLWELGDSRHDLDRALLILAFALPDLEWDELARLSVGQRDALLLQVRRHTLGERFDMVVRCPECEQRMEIDSSVDELLLAGGEGRVSLGDDLAVYFRLLHSRDLAVLRPHHDLETARRLLARCCVLEVAGSGGEPATFDDLDEPALTALSEALAAADPQADLEFALTCPACAHEWAVLFDIARFFWEEIEQEVSAMLHDVHVLAAAYGWHEADILAMTQARRAFYIERVAPGDEA